MVSNLQKNKEWGLYLIPLLAVFIVPLGLEKTLAATPYYDVQYNTTNPTSTTTPDTPGNVYTDRGGTEFTTGSYIYDDLDPRPPMTSVGGYAIFNGQLYQAQTTWSWARDNNPLSGTYEKWRATRGTTTWVNVSWAASNNYVNIIDDNVGTTLASYGDALGSGSITGGGNTVTLSGHGGTGREGQISGTLNLFTNPAGGPNTLQIGYYFNGTTSNAENTGGQITSTGLANINYGYIDIAGTGQVTGRITADNATNATVVNQSGGTVNGGVGNGITIAGVNSRYNMSAGTITNDATVSMNGSGSIFTMTNYANVTGNSKVNLTNANSHYVMNNSSFVDSTATITLGGTGNTFTMNTDAHVSDTAKVFVDGASSYYYMNNDSYIEDGATVTMNGASNTFTMNNGANVTDTAKVYINGTNSYFTMNNSSIVDSNAKVTMSGASNIFTMNNGAKVTSNADIYIDGPDSTYYMHDNTTIDSTATVTMTNTNAVFDIDGGIITGASTSSHASIIMNNGGTTPTTNSKFYLHDNDTVPSQGVVKGHATITMTGAGYNYFEQFGRDTGGYLSGDAIVTITNGHNTYWLHDIAAIDTNAKVIISGTAAGGYNLFRQNGVVGTAGSHIGGHANITMNDGRNTYELFEYGLVDANARFTMNGGYNTFDQFSHTTVPVGKGGHLTGDAIVEINDGHNKYLLHDTALTDGNARVNINDGDNFVDHYGYGDNPSGIHGATLAGTAEINVTGSNNLYRQREDGQIDGIAVVTMGDLGTTGQWFHLYDYANITGTSTINLVADGENHFLMDDMRSVHSDAGIDFINSISSTGKSGGNAINIGTRGLRSYNNSFTQLAGRVSTAAIDASNINGANINLNGAQSRRNVFELDGDTSFNDYQVFIGSNRNTLDDTSTQGVYHQAGGRKNGDVVVTGSQNLFWVNGNSDYHAATSINSGFGANSGRNLAVVDIAGHSRPEAIDHTGFDDAIQFNTPAFIGTLDMSGTTTGNKTATDDNSSHLFFANGDVYGTVTTTGRATTDIGDSSSYVYIGYGQEASLAETGNHYTWYQTNARNLTDLDTSANAILNDPDPDKGPKIGPYFDMTSAGIIADTSHLNVRKVVGGGGEMHVQVTAGQLAGKTVGNVYNLKGGMETDADNIIFSKTFDPAANATLPYVFPFTYPTLYPDVSGAGFNYAPVYQTPTSQTPGTIDPTYYTFTTANPSHFQFTTDFSNGGSHLVYSLLNQDAVNVGAYVDDHGAGDRLYLSPVDVTIGGIRDMGTGSANYDNSYRPIDLSSATLIIPDELNNHTLDYYWNGSYTNHAYGDFYDGTSPTSGRQAQITSGMVNVFAGSKLTIHPNLNEFDTAGLTGTTRENVIDNLNIVGRPVELSDCMNGDCGYSYDPIDYAIVTIDRTTINTITGGALIHHDPFLNARQDPYGLKQNSSNLELMADYTANVVVGTNGILQGFGQITSDVDHTPQRPTIVGDVAVLAGGMLRPYDGASSDPTSKGIFVVHGNALEYNQSTNPADLYQPGAGNRPDYSGAGLFETYASRLKGLIQQVDGSVYFEHGSRLSTRLFAEIDDVTTRGATLDLVSTGSDIDLDYSKYHSFTPLGQVVTVDRRWGDSIEATQQLNFNEIAYQSIYLRNGINNPYAKSELDAGIGYADGQAISGDYYQTISIGNIDPKVWAGVAQYSKVQYQPVMGFVNELKTKLDYEIYNGDGREDDPTYYYQVAYNAASAGGIEALRNMPDANHLFNRDILFSDMLGNWSFLKQADETGVVLRYRLLAKHPQDGGLAIDQKLRNSREVAKKLDEIRYPFLTPVNMADSSLNGLFDADPSLDGLRITSDGSQVVNYVTPYDVSYADGHDSVNYYAYDGNPYDKAGFDGDIERHYYLHQSRFGNYREDWVHDIAMYFHAFQLEVTSQDTAHRAMRLISAEPYASQTNVNFATMDQFIASRERNAVSALYEVETRSGKVEKMGDQHMPADAEVFREDEGMAFVNNPVRFWTAALGGHAKQQMVGDEYGYTTDGAGMQLGAIKEYGDLYFGLTGGFMRDRTRWSDLQAKSYTNSYMGEALLGIHRNYWFLEFSGNFGYMDHKTNRDITLGEYLNQDEYNPLLDCRLDDNYYNGVYSVQHSGNYGDLVWGGGLRLGYQKVLAEKWMFLPTIGLNYFRSQNASGFTEDGPDNAAFRLVFDKGDIDRQVLRVPVMLRLSRVFNLTQSGWILTPEVRAGVTANLLDKNGEATYKWRGNPIPNRYMTAWGLEEDRFTYRAGATLEVSRRGRFYGAANYDCGFWSKNLSHTFSLQAGLNF